MFNKQISQASRWSVEEGGVGERGNYGVDSDSKTIKSIFKANHILKRRDLCLCST